MREEEFRKWLAAGPRTPGTVATQISKVRKLEKYFGDLDELIANGGIEDVAQTLVDPEKAPEELGAIAERRHLRQALSYYRQFNAAGVNAFDHAALARLKDRFLVIQPDFESGNGFTGNTSFHHQEDEYKRALIKRAGELVAQHRADLRKLGGELLNLAANETELTSNIMGWRMAAGLRERRRDHPGLLENAAARIALSSDPEKAVLAFVDETWETAFADSNNNPYSDSRLIPTFIAALTHPRTAITLRTDRFQALSRSLLSQRLFGWNPLSGEELAKANELSSRLFEVMRDDWGWQPRDLWDVQGFIWVTCSQPLGDPTTMTDEELMTRFDGDERFRVARHGWTARQRVSFCSIARTAHAAGLDWYHTNIPEIRLGRKDAEGRDAQGTLGSVQLRKDRAFLQFSHQHGKVGLKGNFNFDSDGADDFAAVMEDALEEIANWQPPEPRRPGRWPDEYISLGNKELNSATTIEPTNLILYGPPGTGKTYHTMEVAVRHCGETPARDRNDLREQYERLRKEKRIEFVTFHQNFSYEEFVEGLRPETGSESESAAEGFKLEPKAGIFRQLCTRADEARKAEAAGPSINLDGRKVFKMSLGRAGVEDEIFEDAWEGGYVVLGWGGDIDWSGYDSYQAIHDRWNADHPGTHGSDSNIAQVNRFVVDMMPGDLVVVSYGNSKIRAIAEVVGPYQFAPTETRDYSHRRSVRWLRRFDSPIDASIVSSTNFSQKSCYPIREANLDREGLATLLPSGSSEDGGTKQFVLVIDEINRANISKVFGELITLIEPDKRLGLDEELSVRLPYSNDVFGVPANLHLIGTMNTADRSIMQIDTALRRRFRFKEMEPDSRLLRTVDGIDLRRVLDTINARIEYLLDRDHAVGHAFFMGDGGKDRTAIDDTMRFKIIPLLQEYFFDDWRNIAAVLGAGFVSGKTLAVPPGIEDRGERTRWTIRWQEEGNSGFPADAYDLLLRGTEAEVDQEDSPDLDGTDDTDEEV